MQDPSYEKYGIQYLGTRFLNFKSTVLKIGFLFSGAYIHHPINIMERLHMVLLQKHTLPMESPTPLQYLVYYRCCRFKQ